MAVSKAIGKLYAKLENSYYSLVESLEGKGVPLHAIINPLEDRGVPSFPIMVGVIVAIVALIVGVGFIGTGLDASFSVYIEDDLKNKLSEVSLTILDDEGGTIFPSETVGDAQTIDLGNLLYGMNLNFKFEKDGYDPWETSRRVTEELISSGVDAMLKKIRTPIVGKIQLVDTDTGNTITDAGVTLKLAGNEIRTCSYNDAEGIFKCNDLHDGLEALVKVSANNYEEFEDDFVFREDEAQIIVLTAKPTALFGIANLLVRVVETQTNVPMDDLRLQLYDVETDELVEDLNGSDSETSLAVDKGNTYRLVVTKQGYLKYDSESMGENKTIIGDEEVWQAVLYPGGVTLSVSIADKTTKAPISGADVILYNWLEKQIGQDNTGFGGFVEFEDLSTELDYYVAASAALYLPKITKVNLQVSTEHAIELERATSSNSADLEIVTVDDRSRVANDASLKFYAVDGNSVMPLGIKVQKTDINGKHLFKNAEIGKTIRVIATKESDEGIGEITIEPNKTNQLLITMSKKEGIVRLVFKDDGGGEICSGHVTVESKDNELLADKDIPESCEIYIDASELISIDVTYEGEDGRVQSSEITVAGKTDVEMVIYSDEAGAFIPKIEFLGVYNLSGQQVEGITKGDDYYLRFETVWPYGEVDGGIHVRVGNDDVKYADSDDVGILGFSGVNANFRYGRTYSYSPAPGIEFIDMQNLGSAGQYNKWIELYFSGSNQGTKIVNIRVKAKETSLVSRFDVHYRAWNTAVGEIYRTPADDVLLFDSYNSERSGLYAAALHQSIRIFDSHAQCENELCVAFKFVREDGSEFEVENFKAANNEVYALEMEITPLRETAATIKASTSKTNPKVAFTGYGIDSFAEFPDNNSVDTSIEVDEVALTTEDATKIRLYFKTYETENAFITAQIITDQTVLTKTFNFMIFVEKYLLVTTMPENITVGQDFSIIVREEFGNPVENATIKLRDYRGRLLETKIGNGLPGNGDQGVYNIQNSFDPGRLKLEVRTEGAKPYESEIEIGKGGVIVLPDVVKVYLQKEQKESSTTVEIENTSSDTIQNIEYEIIRKPNFPAGMGLTAGLPAALRANSRENITVKGEYRGEKESEYGEAELIVRGEILGKYTVSASTKVVVEYNKQLPDECLEVSKSEVAMFVLNDESSTKTETLTLKNTCEVPLNIVSESAAVGHADERLRVDVSSVYLQPSGQQGDTETVTIVAVNELARNYPNKKLFRYDIVFKSDNLTRTIPLNVYIWNAKFALQVNRNIELFVAETNPDDLPPGTPPQVGKAVASVPIYVKNVGEADIENLKFSISAAQSAGHVELAVLPAEGVPVLKVGSSLVPPKWVVVKGLRTEKTTPIDFAQLNVRGSIDGKEYDFGPINITTHISAASCLKVLNQGAAIDFTSFSTKEGTMQKKIRVRNACAEPVRIGNISKELFGSNELKVISMRDIMPEETTEVTLLLRKNSSWQQPPLSVFFNVLLLTSGRWTTSEHFTVQMSIGKEGVFTKDAASEEYTVDVCGGGTEQIRFPIIADSDVCDKAYCDAEQLANYLVKRVANKIKDTKQQIVRYTANAANTNCDITSGKAYCEFSDLGVISKPFFVYFQHDYLSDAALRYAMEKNPELEKYSIEHRSSAEEFFKTVGSLPHKLVMVGEFRGCGQYLVEIKGVVRLESGRKLAADFMNVVIDLNPSQEAIDEFGFGSETIREKTKQCESRVENVMNFLPMDKSYGKGKTGGTWLGMVETESGEMEKIGEEMAKELFGSKERYVSSAPANTLNVRFGVVDNAMVKLIMDTGSDLTPKEITAQIKEATDVEDIQVNVAEEAARAIRDVRNNHIEGCISAEHDYFLLRSTGKLSKLTLGGCKDDILPIVFTQDSCCEFEVRSNIAETIIPSARLFEDKVGTSDPWIETIKGEKIDEDVGVELDYDAKAQQYSTKLKLCIRGEEQFQQAIGKEVVLTAKSAAKDAGKPEEKLHKMQACGIHPYDLIAKLYVENPQKGEFYATVVWKGKPDKVSVKQLKGARAIRSILEEDIPSMVGTGSVKAKELETRERTHKLGGLGFYMAGCVPASMILGTWFGITTGFTGALMNPLFDCVLPAATAASDLFDISEGQQVTQFFKETFGGAAKGIWSFLWGRGTVAGGTAEAALEETDSMIDLVTSDLRESPEEYDLLKMMMLEGAAFGGIYSGWRQTTSKVTAATVNNFSTFAASKLRKRFETQVLTNLKAMDSTIKKNLLSAFEKDVKSQMVEHLTPLKGRKALMVNNLEDAITYGVSNVSKGTFADEFYALAKAYPEAHLTTETKELFRTAKLQQKEVVLRTDEAVERIANRISSIEGTMTPTELKAAVVEAQSEMTKAIKRELKSQGFEITGGVTKEINDAVGKISITKDAHTLKGSLMAGDKETGKLTVSYPKESIRTNVRNAFEEITSPGKAISTQLDKRIAAGVTDDVMKGMTNDLKKVFTATKGEKLWIDYGKLKSFGRSFVTVKGWKSLLGGLGKGVLTAIIANAAGMAAYSVYLKVNPSPQKKIKDSFMDKFGVEKCGNALDDDGDGEIDEADCTPFADDIELVNYLTYKIDVKEDLGKPLIAWGGIIDDPSVLSENAKQLHECKVEDWAVDGQGLRRGIKEIYVRLAPNVKRMVKEDVVFARDYITKYAKWMGKSAEAYDIPEELIVATWIWRARKNPGSEYGMMDCKDAAGKNRPEDKIACGARVLKSALDKCEQEGEVKDMEKIFNSGEIACIAKKYMEVQGREIERPTGYSVIYSNYYMPFTTKVSVVSS